MEVLDDLQRFAIAIETLVYLGIAVVLFKETDNNG